MNIFNNTFSVYSSDSKIMYKFMGNYSTWTEYSYSSENRIVSIRIRWHNLNSHFILQHQTTDTNTKKRQTFNWTSTFNKRKSKLTNILLAIVLDDLGQFQVSGYDSNLIRILIGEVQSVPVGTPEQQLPGAGFLVVHAANVQWRVTGSVLGVHVRPVEQQMLQVLELPVLARLKRTKMWAWKKRWYHQ